jgi:hypothetical protein
MARAHRRAFERRQKVFDEILADQGNPAWEVIQRDKLRDGLDRFDELIPRARQELYGALTAALWLCGDGASQSGRA